MDSTGSLKFLLEGLVLGSLFWGEEFAQDAGGGENCESVHFFLSNTVTQSKKEPAFFIFREKQQVWGCRAFALAETRLPDHQGAR